MEDPEAQEGVDRGADLQGCSRRAPSLRQRTALPSGASWGPEWAAGHVSFYVIKSVSWKRLGDRLPASSVSPGHGDPRDT